MRTDIFRPLAGNETYLSATGIVDDFGIRPSVESQKKNEIPDINSEQVRTPGFLTQMPALMGRDNLAPAPQRRAIPTMARLPSTSRLPSQAVRQYKQWTSNYRQFLDDAKNVRLQVVNKPKFFSEYNETIAPKLNTLEESLQYMG